MMDFDFDDGSLELGTETSDLSLIMERLNSGMSKLESR